MKNSEVLYAAMKVRLWTVTPDARIAITKLTTEAETVWDAGVPEGRVTRKMLYRLLKKEDEQYSALYRMWRERMEQEYQSELKWAIYLCGDQVCRDCGAKGYLDWNKCRDCSIKIRGIARVRKDEGMYGL